MYGFYCKIYKLKYLCKFKFIQFHVLSIFVCAPPINLYGVSEWFILHANSAIVQLYHGENKLISMRW